MNRGSSWPNGSYFRSNDIDDNHISCIYCEALDRSRANDGGWILPIGSSCSSGTSPIKCTNVATDGPTNITLQRVADGSAVMELVYKCCLPNDCDNRPTDIIIANIYRKLLSDVPIYFFSCR